MANLADVESAFMRAHEAGDTGAASVLAAEVRRLRAASQVANDHISKTNPTEGMSGADKFLAGTGKAFTDLARGARQLLPGGASNQAAIDESQKLDAPLMKTGAGVAGNVVGNLVPALATAAIPGANTVTGAMAVNAGLGLLMPTTSGEGVTGKLTNAGLGAVTGGAAQGAANALGRALAPVASNLTPEAQRLAQVAAREGIPLDAAAQTGSKPLQIINSVMENLPFTAGREAAKKQATQSGFNRAVLDRAGIAGDSAAPDVLAAQKRALGQQFEDIAGRNTLDLTPLGQRFVDISRDASRRLTPDQHQVVANIINDIVDQGGNAQRLAGGNYQAWRSELGRMARGNDAQAHFIGQVKRALDDAFSSQVSQADAQAWQQASRQYGNLKTISQAMGGAGNAAASGNVSAAQLAQALAGSVSKEGKALGRGELNDLARVGQLFVKDQVPNSGTAQRAFYQSLLTGGLGLGGGVMAGGDPTEAALYGAMGLAAPRLAQSALNSGAVQRYLTQGVASPTAQALARTLQQGALPAAAASLLTQQ